METFLTIIFAGFLMTFVPGSLLIFLLKKPEASLKEMYFRGGFIVRDLDKYIPSNGVFYVKLLLNVGSILFCLWVLIGVAHGLSQRF